MATIEQRGPYQFRAKVRRKGVTQTKTFDYRTKAEEWARVVEGKITGDEHVDRRLARDTTLSQACDWLLGWGVGTKSDAKKRKNNIRYLNNPHLAGWSR
jgi:hypothetical protein